MANGDVKVNSDANEPGIEGGIRPRLNDKGVAAVNAYLRRFAFLLVAGNLTALAGIAGSAYYTVQSVKAQSKADVLASIESARTDAREAAVATAVAAVKDEKALQEAALASIGNSVEAARAAGNLDGTVGQIRAQINGLQPRIEAISSAEKSLSSEIESLKELLADAKKEKGYVNLIQAIDGLRKDSKGAVTLLNRLQGIFDEKQSIDSESGFISSGQIAICFGKVKITGSSGPTRGFEATFPVSFRDTPFIANSINSKVDTGFSIYGHTLTNTTYSGSLVTVGDKNNNSISSGASVVMHYIAVGTISVDLGKPKAPSAPE
ncbi:hypothetical protein U8335_13845 [Roseiconus lacunae]|uniref:hypothetical protein n=1 Tax=Roseiconus lacunae TaxID=2605694 RepID=UPI003092DD68|nr:hypothetical protein U8335_13845 [Stieleria sp. HD01]